VGIGAVDGQRAFVSDPGLIAPDVLRYLWLHLLCRCGPSTRARLIAAAQSVGLAGVWSAVVGPGPCDQRVDALLSTLLGALEREPQLWRRMGSDLCSAALVGRLEQLTPALDLSSPPLDPRYRP
jgi:hypothetical protein